MDKTHTTDLGHLTRKPWFRFEIDQSYLPSLTAQCRTILETYPLRGRRTA